MARIRTIKPQFFLNDELAELPAMVRLLFIGLWTQADREGRLHDRPKRLKAELFPYENYDVDKGLKLLAETGFIERYAADGITLIQISNFSKHQQPHLKESSSTLPAPCKTGASPSGREGKGIGREQEGNAPCAGGEGEQEATNPPPAEEKPPRSAPPPQSYSYCVMPWDSAEFKDAWDLWKVYKKEQHKFVYKGNHSEQAALMGLSEKAEGVEETALAILRQSMANGWSGLFKLRTEKNDGKPNPSKPRTGGPNDGYKRKMAERMGFYPGGS